MPVFGMYPERHVGHGDVRRRERAERLDRPYGRDTGPRGLGRAWIIGLIFVPIAVAVVGSWMNVPLRSAGRRARLGTRESGHEKAASRKRRLRLIG